MQPLHSNTLAPDCRTDKPTRHSQTSCCSHSGSYSPSMLPRECPRAFRSPTTRCTPAWLEAKRWAVSGMYSSAARRVECPAKRQVTLGQEQESNKSRFGSTCSAGWHVLYSDMELSVGAGWPPTLLAIQSCLCVLCRQTLRQGFPAWPLQILHGCSQQLSMAQQYSCLPPLHFLNMQAAKS